VSRVISRNLKLGGITYKLAGHESYLKDYKEEWKSDIKTFLAEN